MLHNLMRFVFGVVLVVIIGLMPACQTTGPASRSTKELVVGVSPDYPPVIFQQGDRILGIEVDLAAQLGRELGRKVRFMGIRWQDQIDVLLRGETDIIMSGMTITDARKVRIAFSKPYLQLGVMPLVRTRDAAKYSNLDNILHSDARIGVQKGSTADVFVNRYCRSSAIVYVQPVDAHFFLVTRRIDVYLHDGPGVIWLAAENEADLEAIRKPLTKDEIAWGMRKDDQALIAEVNAALEKWKKDGTLKKILNRWLPKKQEKQ